MGQSGEEISSKTVASEIPGGKKPGNHSFKKILVLVLIILGVLYGPGLFKKGSITIPGLEVTQTQPDNFSPFPVKRLAKFSLNPSPDKTFFVTAVCAAGANKLAVTDSPGCQVLIYDFDGKLIRKWGGKNGSKPTEFNEPSGITTDQNGHLYVLDTWNGAVKIFDLNGKLQKVLDLAHFGFFYGPRWIGWGGNNSFLIPNSPNFHLGRLSLAGELLNVWQGKDEIGEALCALGDGKGHYYIGTIKDKKGVVETMDELGKEVRSVKVENIPTGMALDSKGRLYVLCGDIKVFDPEGKLLGVLTDEGEGKPAGINGIYITSNDTILTCGGDEVKIYEISVPKEK